LRPLGEAPVWSKIGDISEGGCFVEMMIPLKAGTRLKISLWLKDNKVMAEGVVANSRPGFGVGIKFTEMSSQDSEKLRDFVKSLVSIPAQSLTQI
jgi:PilZ domain